MEEVQRRSGRERGRGQDRKKRAVRGGKAVNKIYARIIQSSRCRAREISDTLKRREEERRAVQ